MDSNEKNIVKYIHCLFYNCYVTYYAICPQNKEHRAKIWEFPEGFKVFFERGRKLGKLSLQKFSKNTFPDGNVAKIDQCLIKSVFRLLRFLLNPLYKRGTLFKNIHDSRHIVPLIHVEGTYAYTNPRD